MFKMFLKMELTITYKGELENILKAISNKNPALIKADTDSDMFDEEDLIFDKFKISGEKITKDETNNEKTITFKCGKDSFLNVMKLVRLLKSHGDVGHSFTVNANGKNFGWDGDGSDRIFAVNGIHLNSWKDVEKKYSEILNASSGKDGNIEKMVNEAVRMALKTLISENK